MKKLFFLTICLIFNFTQSSFKAKRKYETCKANCSVGCGCELDGLNCEHNCYRAYCRTACFEKYNKECKACFENSKDKLACFNSPACKNRRECLDECEFIYETSTEKNDRPVEKFDCSSCYCFKEGTNEFIGKTKNSNGACTECNLACKKAYAALDNECGVKGHCRSIED